ncbi:DUF262 domain-containing protein [Mucilaginibacter sp. HME9299]|uniref:DUF262 domain-containing protein n=2 Tax=Mucilaginibacter aquatilis TaxID=1517760 RepID=A0A6I4I8D7_9SPHI|nr:DUF262 domain-containing protein [Mucilaginibacter aquatilis]
MSGTRLETKVMSLKDLLADHDLTIPVYQRPYSWTDQQVIPLMSDLYKAKKGDTLVMGSLIFHRNGSLTDIVDGQQRLTTFAILHRLLNTGASNFLMKRPFRYLSAQENVRKNAALINDMIKKKGGGPELDFADIFFIVLYAPDLDDAFAFFDSQNSRGKRLDDHEILKAHHLRYIADPALAEDCAVKWQSLEKDPALKIGTLLGSILGRGRKWGRKEYRELDIKKEFRSQRIHRSDRSGYLMNRYQQAPLFRTWRYDPVSGKGLELFFDRHDGIYRSGSILINDDALLSLPLQITQSLEGGESFFWFTQKYYQLYKQIIVGNKLGPFFRELETNLKHFDHNTGTRYVHELFVAAVIFYVDKFGHEEADYVLACLFFTCYHLRFKQPTVQYSSVYRYIREEHNPFALIERAGHPDYIVERCNVLLEGAYREQNIKSNSIREKMRISLFEDPEHAFFLGHRHLLPRSLSFLARL